MKKDVSKSSSFKFWGVILVLFLLYFGAFVLFDVPMLVHYFAVFFVGTVVMIWRLNHLMYKGFEGTVLGTLLMPYASGFSNLVFVFIVALSGGAGVLVLENSIVNNVTNLTFVLGVPAILWGLSVVVRKGRKKVKVESQINRVSLVVSIVAGIVFTLVLWALARDSVIDFNDGLVLIILFLFWQLFQISEVAKKNISQSKKVQHNVVFDVLLVLFGAYMIYWSMDSLVDVISSLNSSFLNERNLGWITGWLSVIPNASLAFYYGFKRRAEVVYSSQIGDSHICIPLAIGLFAMFSSIAVSSVFYVAIGVILASLVLHLLFVGGLGRLPRFVGLLLVGVYFVFVYIGFI